MAKSVVLFFVTCVLLTAAVACSPRQNDYSDFIELPATGWIYGDTLDFIPDITDSVAEGTLIVSVRHNNDYAFSNLWIEVTTGTGAGTQRDTIDMRLADRYGRWQGNGFGATYRCSDTITGMKPLFRGVPVKVRHIMRVDTLIDIEQLGITFVPSTKHKE